MSAAMKQGAVVSTVLHAAILAALLLSLPLAPPQDQPPSPDVEFDVMSDQPRQVAKAAEQSPLPAAAVAPRASPAPKASPAPPAPQPPKPAAYEPPPPPRAAPVPAKAAPSVPPPDLAPAPALPMPPPLPPSPKPPPARAVPSPAVPRPPPPVPVPPAPTSQASQPNPAKNAAPDMRAVDNTLEKFRLAEQRSQASIAKASPLLGAAVNTGGSPSGDITAKLTGEQRGAIGDKVRECWTKDAGALDLAKMSVIMTVTVDAAGVVREAVVGDADRGKLSDPRFRAFAERAERANRDARCADLGQLLPKSELGHVVKLTFRFRP